MSKSTAVQPRRDRTIRPDDGPKVLAQCISRIRRLAPEWQRWVLRTIGELPVERQEALPLEDDGKEQT